MSRHRRSFTRFVATAALVGLTGCELEPLDAADLGPDEAEALGSTSQALCLPSAPPLDHDGKDWAGNRYAKGVAVDAQGRAYVGGMWGSLTGQHFLLTRWSAGGMDQDFGDRGFVTTDFASTKDEGIADVAIDAKGRVVVAGYADDDDGRVFALARYLPSGALDPSFDGDGKVLTDFASSTAEEALALAVVGNEIVAVGFAKVGGQNRLALARYQENGALEPSFDGDGKVLTDVADMTGELATAVVATSSHVTVVGTGKKGNLTLPVAARYFMASGALDGAFGDGGQVIVPSWVTSSVADVVRAPGAGIVMAGHAEYPIDGVTHRFMTAIALRADGTIDTSFGQSGTAWVDFKSADLEWATSIVRAPDGRYYLGGGAIVKGSMQFAMARLTAKGVLDETWDGDGKVLEDLDSSAEQILAMDMSRGGQLYATGMGSWNGQWRFATSSRDLEPLSQVKGDTTCEFGDPDCNRCVPNVQSQFAAWGAAWLNVKYDSRAGDALPPYDATLTQFNVHNNGVDWDWDPVNNFQQNHVQGFARIAMKSAGDRAYFVATRSQFGSVGRGGFFIARANTWAGRTGDNLFNPTGYVQGGFSWDGDMSTQLFYPVSDTNHPGGLSVVGSLLFYPGECAAPDFEGSTCDGRAFLDSVRLGSIEQEDLNPATPGAGATRFDRFELDGSRGEPDQHGTAASSVAVTRLANGRYLAIVAGRRTEQLWFYESHGEPDSGGFTWEYEGAKNDCGLPDRWMDSMYQNMTLLTECGTGDLYLVGHGSDGDSLNGQDDTNYLDLYRLAPSGAGLEVQLVKQRTFDASTYCTGAAGASMYVTPDGDLTYYCSSKVTNDDGELKFMERYMR